MTLFQRAAGGGGTGYIVVLVYARRRPPRRAPGWAERGFEVVTPLARAAPPVRRHAVERKDLGHFEMAMRVGLQELAMDLKTSTYSLGLSPAYSSDQSDGLLARAKDTVPHMELSVILREAPPSRYRQTQQRRHSLDAAARAHHAHVREHQSEEEEEETHNTAGPCLSQATAAPS